MRPLCPLLGPQDNRGWVATFNSLPALSIGESRDGRVTDSDGSFPQSLLEVEALFGYNWEPLHVTVPGSSPQRYEQEARHFRDLMSNNYFTHCVEIVVHHWWTA